MQMIDVLKRLAELDAKNPNVAQPVVKADESLAVISDAPEVVTEGIQLPNIPEPDLAALKALAGTKQLNECGMMGSMPPPAPTLPASINMSAGNAGEIVAMFKGIMDLAKSDGIPTQAAMPTMGAPMPSLTPPMGGMDEPAAEPEAELPAPVDDTGSDELADMMKKLRTGEPVKIKTDMPVKVSTDDDVKATTNKEVKSSSDDLNKKEAYDNSPEEKVKDYNPNDFANIINKVRSADLETTPYGSGSNPMPEEEEKKMGESLEDQLMAEYRKFMAEAKPDFLDLDKDGNKKEPMKKAAKDAKKK